MSEQHRTEPMSEQHSEQHRTLICMPCMETMPTRTVTSLIGMERPGKSAVNFTVGSLIYEARNEQSAMAINQGYDRIMWIDSDMRFDRDVMVKLGHDLDDGCDFVAALAFKRQLPLLPVIYKTLDHEETDREIRVTAVPWDGDIPRDTVFPVAGSGFGCCMIKTSMLKAIWEQFGPPFTPISKIGEDLAFCIRAKKAGYTLYCDSRVRVGHLGYYEYGLSEWGP